MEKYLDKNSVLRLLQGIKTQIDKSKTSVLGTKGAANGIASLDENGNVPLSQLGNVDTDIHEIALELPTQLTEKQSKHIFLVPRGVDEKTNKNIYKEYIFTGSDITNVKDTDWEQLGEFTTSVDLKDYSKKSETISDIRFTDRDVDGSWTSNTILNNLLFEFADGKQKVISIPLASSPFHGTAHQSPGGPGFMSGEDKAKLDDIDLNALTASINAANTAANNTNNAIRAAETATTGAEKVNAKLEGNVLKVTNRNGEVKSLDFEQWDLEEKVNISISTSVEGVSVNGIVVNVFLNGATTSTKYTSDAEGKISFAIPRGTIYKVSFQELKNCDPLPSLTYTAALRVRDINVEYKALSGETASVVVTIDKAENGAVKPLQGVSVTCEIANGDTTTTETNENGKVTFSIPWGKTYKITAGKPEGYYAFKGIYEKNNVADVAEHNLYYHFFPVTSGVFILDTAGAQYTLDEWQQSGKTAQDAALVKITTQNLAGHNSSVGFSPSALQAGYPSKQWCTQNVLFNNIPTNGNNTNDALYYDGYKSSKLIREEAQERGLSVPAFSYAYECTVEMAGETLHGYIASVGQMAEMNINRTVVDNVIKALYGDTAKLFSPLFTMQKWTSTQYTDKYAWGFSRSKFTNFDGTKSFSLMVLPVFAC